MSLVTEPIILRFNYTEGEPRPRFDFSILMNPSLPPSFWARTSRACLPTTRYWMETEVHVYAFSVAANLLLSFFPFLIVMLSLCQHVFKWRAGADAIYFALSDYFPDPLGEFLQRNLRVTVASRGPFQGQ